MAKTINVNIRNFGAAFLVQARGGRVTHCAVKNEIGGAAKMQVGAGADYVAGASKTPVAFDYASGLLKSYTDKFAASDGKLSANVLMILPDDAAVRTFEVKRLIAEAGGVESLDEESYDAILSKVTKDWMREERNVAWKNAMENWLDVYVGALAEGLHVDAMKISNINSWELRLGENATLVDGQKITIKDGKVEGVDAVCENNLVSGEFVVRRQEGREFEGNKRADRYSVQRGGSYAEITNMRKALNALYAALPHRQEVELVEAGESLF